MYDNTAYLCGQLDRWPSKDEMAGILQNAGVPILPGRYSIRIADCSHFVFQHYGGDLGEPCIDADADSPEEMMADAKPISDALAAADIRHRFSIYDQCDDLAGYIHHRWPQEDAAPPGEDVKDFRSGIGR